VNASARSRYWLAAQIVVTVALLGWLARGLDLGALRRALTGLPLSFYVGSLLVVVAGQIAYAWRWRLLLQAAGAPVPFTHVVRQYFVGIFVNNFLPSTVGGDVAKVYYLGKRYGYTTVTASVAVDRVLGVGLLAALAAGALIISPVSAPRLTAAQVACALVAIAALGVLIITSVGTGGLAARVAWLGDGAVRLANGLQRLRLDMAAPLGRPGVVVQAAVVVIGYTMAVTAVYMRFLSVQQPALPPFVAMFAVVTATIVLSNVPVSLNGLGLREQLHASLLAPLGVPAETAVAISLLLYVHLLAASLIGLVFWMQARSA
jgi:uncharacterized protein (TIRG00374 family)